MELNKNFSNDNFFDGEGENFDESTKMKSDSELALANLQNCQKELNLNSCFKCNTWEKCMIRTSYVNLVYKKMSNNEDGDFDF